MTIYVLSEDTRYREHTTSLHATKETLHAEMRGIIEARLAKSRSTSLADDPQADAEHEAERQAILQRLAAGDVPGAWTIFNDGLHILCRVKSPYDLYYVDTHESDPETGAFTCQD